MIKEYRIAKRYVWLAIGGIVFSLVLAIAGTMIACTDPDVNEPGLFLLLTSAVGGGLLVISLYILIACYRERLSLYSWGIRDKGVFKTKDISFSDTDNLVWEPATGTVVVYSTALSKTRIYLRNYNKESRQEIIALFREKLAENIQRDWLRFMQLNIPDSSPSIEYQKQLWKRKAWFAVFIGMIFCGFGTAFLIMENPDKKWARGQKEAMVAVNWGGAAILFFSAANHWRKNRRKNK
ncbi:MAG: hypothetical protein LBV12_03630 [Puniceicoccales bacterium]|nr:hypothetical protein [Puniceicoccales bacterium]